MYTNTGKYESHGKGCRYIQAKSYLLTPNQHFNVLFKEWDYSSHDAETRNIRRDWCDASGTWFEIETNCYSARLAYDN